METTTLQYRVPGVIWGEWQRKWKILSCIGFYRDNMGIMEKKVATAMMALDRV